MKKMKRKNKLAGTRCKLAMIEKTGRRTEIPWQIIGIHFLDYKKAEKVHKEAKKAVESARAGLSLLDRSQNGFARRRPEKPLRKLFLRPKTPARLVGAAPPPKNVVERVILQYVDRFLAEFFLLLTYTNR